MKISLYDLNSTKIDISTNRKLTIQIGLENLIKQDNLTFDIYPVENPSHPERHFGYWVFSNLEEGKYYLNLDLNRMDEKSVNLLKNNIKLPLESYWVNENKSLDPLLNFQIVIRRKEEIVKMVHLFLILKNPEELEKFYKENGGKYEIDTLNLAFHNRRLKVLKSVFKKYFGKGDRILDAGSGIGILKMLSNPMNNEVYCLDIDYNHDIKQGENNIFYITGNADNPPFKRNQFDSLYSGELIEHLLRPKETLREWNKLLKKNGHLIITTPNINRIINRARGYKIPLSKEHINELCLKEVLELFKESGFKILKKRGIYLELFVTWWRKENVVDLFQTRFNKKWAYPFIQLLMILGYFFPSLALDMIIIAKKNS